jgi:hypothetical protein
VTEPAGGAKGLINPPRQVRPAFQRLGGGTARPAGVHVGGDPAWSVPWRPSGPSRGVSELRRGGGEQEIDYRSRRWRLSIGAST